MNELIDILQYEWAWRALLGSSMVGLMCGLLGCFIVLRNMALIGDALSHAILPGIVVAFIVAGYNLIGFFVGSVAAGLVSAAAMTWIQQNAKTKNDAAIGIVFTAMFSVGVIGITWLSKNEGVHLDLKDFLFGNVLGVGNEDLWLTAAICLFVILSTIVFYRYLFISTFQPTIAQTMGISVKMIHYYLMLLLSFAIVAALQTVGVILVVAMLITPASTALLLSNRLPRVLAIAALVGVLSAFLGLIAAIVLETTPGPAMAIVATCFYLLALVAAPEKGLLARRIIRRKTRIKILDEHLLKEAIKLDDQEKLNNKSLGIKLALSDKQLSRQLTRLRKQDLIHPQHLTLTEQGRKKAFSLIRAHRLWETYLVDKIGLNEEQIHEEADKFEHILSGELLDEVDKSLGYPSKDPHGSPIPPKFGTPSSPLTSLSSGLDIEITTHQVNDSIIKKLWTLGLVPGKQFKLLSSEEDILVEDANNSQFRIPFEIARSINAVVVDQSISH